MFGRNTRVAWGCTNNICSQRDLYQEKTDPSHPDCFLFDGRWEPARQLEEVIRVKGADPLRKTIRFSRNGPIVDAVLPPAARNTGPVALKWLGAYRGGWLTALLAMNRAASAAAFREATRPWHVPTFSLVFADVDGHIGYQATGAIPVRKVWERGYRPGWDPRHQWDGLIPHEGMPQCADPERGWIATANNRPAPDDFPYPLSGTWSDGLRAGRIRQLLEAASKDVTHDYFIAMHQDALSLRAERCVPGLRKALASLDSRLQPAKAGTPTVRRLQEAAKHLGDWDCRLEVDRIGATIFEVFFVHWTRAVARARFEGDLAGFLAGGVNGLAASLLLEDSAGWFPPGQRESAVQEAMTAALDWLSNRLGSDMQGWAWGDLHTLPLRHVLSGRGDLAQLLDHGGLPVKGAAVTVCNTGLGAQYEARAGAGYRLIADLHTSPPGLWAVDGQGQSGHPGSPHYNDQLTGWLGGHYHYLSLDQSAASHTAVNRLVLEPRG
jgi:penicillin amidase